MVNNPISLYTAKRPLITQRQLEVMYGVAMGVPADIVQKVMHISKQTYHSHIFNTKRRLGVKTKTEAVMRLIKLGFIDVKRLPGFMLIELLVVIAIMGIISAIAFPAIAPIIKLRLIEDAKTEQRTLQAAVDKFTFRNSLDYATENGLEDGTPLSSTYLFTMGYLYQDTTYAFNILTSTGEVSLLWEGEFPRKRN